MRLHNANKTCWNCPAIDLAGKVDFRACGQSVEAFQKTLPADSDVMVMAECKRRPELGLFDPMSITFEECPEWIEGPYGYMLEDMRVMILGIDGYLGWTLALWLGSLGFEIAGIDNYARRIWLMEQGADSVVPIAQMPERLEVAQDVLNIDIDFHRMDIAARSHLREFIEDFKPESIVHYAECPSAPFSMIDAEHAIDVQRNNVLGTLGLLFIIKDTVPESALLKLGCYDDQTEILTEEGWKLFRELEEDDRVATRSKDDRRLAFKKPNSIHEYDYKGKMYYQENTRLDFCVTPNHRIFTQKRSNTSYKELRLESVQDVEGQRRVYDIGFEWEGKSQEHFTIPDTDVKIPMELWVKFLGWYLSEGSVRQRSDRPNNYRVAIKQKIGAEGIQDLEEVLSNLAELLGRELRKYRDENHYAFIIGRKELASYLDEFGKAADKHIPRKIKQLNQDLLRELLLSLIAGDGWKHRPAGDRDNLRYFTISRQLADDVQEIALKCGYGAIVSYSEPKQGYTVYICQAPRVHANHSEDPTDGYVNYDGKVWCVNVGGDGIVFARRNGKPVWSGNTMGEYGTPLTGRPLFEGLFPADAVLHWDGREWSMGGELTPRDPVSFYHVSKVQDTFNIYEACKYWWLRSYDIMQGVIYGVHTPQLAADSRLRTRLDIDEWFGTVINRFVAQAVVGIPLTIYGAGEQVRGFIGLRDAMQCMTRLIVSPPEPGQYGVVNQMSGYYSIRELAEMVAEVGREAFNLPVKIQRVENPRVEADRHPFEPIYENLPKQYGFRPEVSPEDEIYRMFELLTRPHIRKRIQQMMYHIVPSTWWSGDHRRVETIEVLEWEEEKEPLSNDGREHEGPVPEAQVEVSEAAVGQAGGDGREREQERVGEGESGR